MAEMHSLIQIFFFCVCVCAGVWHVSIDAYRRQKKALDSLEQE